MTLRELIASLSGYARPYRDTPGLTERPSLCLPWSPRIESELIALGGKSRPIVDADRRYVGADCGDVHVYCIAPAAAEKAA